MKFANRTWYYEFSEIPQRLKEGKCQVAAERLLERYAALTKLWSAEKNTEWLCRLYLAAKLIMHATLTVNSMQYAESRNLRVIVPYLRYYSLLSLLRSLILTLPEQQWNDGNLIQIRHDKAIRIAVDHVSHIDSPLANQLKDDATLLKSSRELISYRAPSSGDNMLPQTYSLLSLCSLIAELSQFNSELLEASLEKNANPDTFLLIKDHLYNLSNVEIGGYVFGDPEDAYRLDYFNRKQPHPCNLLFLMREGHVDDFFGAWCDEEVKLGNFNPDEMTGIIFDIP